MRTKIGTVVIAYKVILHGALFAYLSDPLVTSQVNDRALLILGALARTMLPYKPMWATRVIRQVETDLGTHGTVLYALTMTLKNRPLLFIHKEM